MGVLLRHEISRGFEMKFSFFFIMELLMADDFLDILLAKRLLKKS